MLNHLFHRAILQELAVLIAVHAVIFLLTPVGICAEDIICERHSATLTKSLFHKNLIYFDSNIFDAAKLLIVAVSTKLLG